LAERCAGTWRPGERLAWTADSDALAIGGVAVAADVIPQRLADVTGAFAGAWTDEAGRLHVARDPLGHRSMFVHRGADGVVRWGTRIADLLAAGAPRDIDPIGVTAFLTTAFVPGERTLLAGVRAVQPGTELVFDAYGEEVRTFWSIPPQPAVFDDEEKLRTRLRALLEQTVGRMLPQGRVAASLSGGIDSSAVVALARAAGAEVEALSITFGAPHADELAWSGLLAKHTGARHHVVTVRAQDVIDGLDATVQALSEPNGDPLTVPNRMMFQAARALGCDVMLNGEGGDPCFGGPKNGPMLLAELYGDAHARERSYLRAHQRLWDDLPAAAGPALRDAHLSGAIEGLVTPWLSDVRWPGLLDRLLALNVAWKGASHILPKVEHLGLAEGVRPRSPLFDRDVVALAFALPAQLKRAGAVEKHLFKASVADLVPEAIRDRPKSGMLVPVEAWLSGPLRAFARERLLDGLAPWGFVDKAWMERLIDGRGEGLRPRRGVKLWLLLTLESWLRGLRA